jgi:hypothetical protein
MAHGEAARLREQLALVVDEYAALERASEELRAQLL